MAFRTDALIQKCSQNNGSNAHDDLDSNSSLSDLDVDSVLDTHESNGNTNNYDNDSISDPDAYYYITPMLKALLDRYADVMELQRLTPNLPDLQSANFVAEFKEYAGRPDGEWKKLVDGRVRFHNIPTTIYYK